MNILTLNCGSSSIKYKLFDMPKERVIARGQAERIGRADSILHHEIEGKAPFTGEQSLSGHREAIERLLNHLIGPEGGILNSVRDIVAVGHRFVHGGEFFRSSVAIDPGVRETLEACRNLAPLHNPHNLTGIDVCTELIPHAPQVAVFDTAFHQTMPDHAFTCAIPYRFYEENRIRKYGFHGTSHRYVSSRASELLGKGREEWRIVTCHLGNGSSLCAVRDGKSCDTTMGFTPLSGVVMGTRCGDIDPALPAHLVEALNIPLAEVMSILNHESGVLGISGLSPDFRDLESAADGGHARARLALTVYAYSIARGIASLIPAIGGLDALVFTAGIGENSPRMRARICAFLAWLGVELDAQGNEGGVPEIDVSRSGSPVRVLVIPTDEERLIARDTVSVLGYDGEMSTGERQRLSPEAVGR
ncbi:MAG: acetate kinase [Deltaproteobacteria bacterium HGW-Deltaproteobacteria-19]|jgi:acetate kinase|nr:MAG: acetate kinase [Deltaproteobacteria bacterium HGW-Deltaproteobacteria-19]